MVTALNPKSIVFFVAFLPQFLDLTQPVLPQMVIFEITFLVLATLNAFSYALLASAARKTIRKPSVQKVVNRTGRMPRISSMSASSLPMRSFTVISQSETALTRSR